MARPLQFNPDRLLPAEPAARGVARKLPVNLPIISPHGHAAARAYNLPKRADKLDKPAAMAAPELV